MGKFLNTNILNAFLGSPRVKTSGVSVGGLKATGQFKTTGYASIPYEKLPVVIDTVPTKDAQGNPLLAGYVTPNKTWVC